MRSIATVVVAALLVLSAAAVAVAAEPESMSVQVRKGQLRAKPTFLAPIVAVVSYGDRVQVEGDELSGRVVTLGQQLLADGSSVTIPDGPDRNAEKSGKAHAQ